MFKTAIINKKKVEKRKKKLQSSIKKAEKGKKNYKPKNIAMMLKCMHQGFICLNMYNYKKTSNSNLSLLTDHRISLSV